MTTIILTVLGILLAAAAAIMVTWYGGDAFAGGRAKATANTLVNNLQQFDNAIRLYELETGSRLSGATSLTVLSPDYLRTLPSHPYWESSVPQISVGPKSRMLFVILYDQARSACQSINRSMVGSSELPVVTNWREQLRGPMGCYETGAPAHNTVLWTII